MIAVDQFDNCYCPINAGRRRRNQTKEAKDYLCGCDSATCGENNSELGLS